MSKIKKDKIVIGIDQSYADSGIAGIKNKTDILFCRSLKSVKETTHTEYRDRMKQFVRKSLYNVIGNDIIVIVERIGIRANSGGLSQSYVKSNAALIAAIIDACDVFDIPVYSVDTRVWKKAIVGTSKPLNNKYGIPPEKYPTIKYIRDSGRLSYIVDKYEGKGNKGVISAFNKRTGERYRAKLNDNRADSICIAEYGFLTESEQKLQLERF